MNKVELTNKIFQIADMWHLNDYVPDSDFEDAFFRTLQSLMNYEYDEVENIIECLKTECENAIENEWDHVDSYKPTFDLYDTVMTELYELLEEC